MQEQFTFLEVFLMISLAVVGLTTAAYSVELWLKNRKMRKSSQT